VVDELLKMDAVVGVQMLALVLAVVLLKMVDAAVENGLTRPLRAVQK